MAGSLSTSIDRRIRELTSLRLALRDDLVLSPGFAAGPETYSIEDPATGKFYYIGAREFAFLTQLDGRMTLGQALQHAATHAGDSALTEHEAATLCRWLVDHQLARTPGSPPGETGDVPGKGIGEAARRFNPLAFKVSLLDPEEWLSSLAQSCGWIFGRAALTVWSMTIVSALARLLANADSLPQASRGVLATSNWLWLGLSWLLLKFVHELSHGIVCKRYGGTVRDAGLLFILLTPVAYVDITSAWRFRSKWQRIHTAAAGMYAELFVAAIAVWVWTQASPGLPRHVAFNVMLMASVTTLAFNANPLMKFDGYYMLADWLEIPNLSTNAARIWRGWMRWLFLGIPAAACPLPVTQRRIAAIYGFAAMGWRTLVTISLVLAASALFHGAGIILAVTGAVLWWLVPLATSLLSIWDARQGRPDWTRCGLASSVVAGVVASLFTLVPWIGPYRAPAVVEFMPLAIVRAGSPGFVVQVHVRSGDVVRRDDVLLRLENPELQQQLRDLELQVEQGELTSRMLQREGKLAEFQAEQEKIASLRLQLVEKSAEVAALTVRADRDGIVMGRRLTTLPGTYLAKGDEILAIGEEESKELRISVAQQDVRSFCGRVGQPLQIAFGSGEFMSGTLAKLEPLASTLPPHAALGANCGGPIPVTERRELDDARRERVCHEFLTPRFLGVVPLDRDAAAAHFSGQLGEVSFRTYEESFGEHLLRSCHRWIQERLEELTRGSSTR